MNKPGLINFAGLTCKEASPLSREMYIPCGRAALGIVSHRNHTEIIPMCHGCISHNCTNRGGLLIAGTDEVSPEYWEYNR